MTDESTTSAGAVPVTPPAMIGIVGGGPMGRYLALAARQMGYGVAVVDPDPSAPAHAVADVRHVAALDDLRALGELADACAVVTVAVDDAPADALRSIDGRTLLRPAADAVATCADRIAQRHFLDDLGVPLAPWRPIVTADDVAATSDFDFPGILKPLHRAADSPRQVQVTTHARLPEAWGTIGNVPCVLERRMRVFKEISIVVARAADGRTACSPIAQNLYIGGRLDATHVPAALPPNGREGIEELAAYIADELGVVGIVAIELFIVGRAVLVNEIALCPHPSGVYTLEACATSQFEQQVRAVCGLGLGSAAMASPGAATVAIPGDLWAAGTPDWTGVLSDESAHLHLYGRDTPCKGRIEGHVTVVSRAPTAAVSKARLARTRATPRRPSATVDDDHQR